METEPTRVLAATCGLVGRVLESKGVEMGVTLLSINIRFVKFLHPVPAGLEVFVPEARCLDTSTGNHNISIESAAIMSCM